MGPVNRVGDAPESVAIMVRKLFVENTYLYLQLVYLPSEVSREYGLLVNEEWSLA